MKTLHFNINPPPFTGLSSLSGRKLHPPQVTQFSEGGGWGFQLCGGAKFDQKKTVETQQMQFQI